MEDEERPTKLQKLNHTAQDDEPAVMQAPLKALQRPLNNQNITSEDEGASKPVEDATADSADEQDDQDHVEKTLEPSAGPLAASGPNQPISKNQQKKLRKAQEWEANRDARKLKRKQKIVAGRERKRAARREEQTEQQTSTGLGTNGRTSRPQSRSHIRLPVTFIIDCGFDDLMTEKERISLGSQLTRSYSDNHRAPFQAHLMVSSWGGLLKERFDTVLNRHYENWRGVRFVTENFVEAAAMANQTMKSKGGGKLDGAFSSYARASDELASQDKLLNHEGMDQSPSQGAENRDVMSKGESEALPGSEKAHNDQSGIEEANGSSSAAQSADPNEAIKGTARPIDASAPPGSDEGEVIYLTSDSAYTLEKLEPYHTYIIGGLVDKNRHKGICYKTARDKGIKTAKLPIGQYMEMQSRFVLATNHVLEIMVRWLECGDWGKAFMQVIPKRKGAKLRNGNSDDADEAEGTVSQEDEDGEEVGIDSAAADSVKDVVGEDTPQSDYYG